MSRSALWRQEAGVLGRQRHARDVFQQVLEEGRSVRRSTGGGKNAMVPLYGPDDSFHIHPVLLEAIVTAPYFTKCCQELMDWNAIVDEIYYQVKHLEPWAAGVQSKTPSSAFCLLLRLLCLRCTEKQMDLLLNHVDSPYIRCIGFLYLRYACEPTQLWRFIEPFVFDEEEVQLQAQTHHGTPVTVGQYVRQLFGKELEYYGTRLPRLPLLVERTLSAALDHAEEVDARAQDHLRNPSTMSYFRTLGSQVRALYHDEDNPIIQWYDAVVDRVITTSTTASATTSAASTGARPSLSPKFVVTFTEYGNTETVTLGEMDLPLSMKNGSKQQYSASKTTHGNPTDGRGRWESTRDGGFSRDNRRAVGYDDHDQHHRGYGRRDGPVDRGNHHRGGGFDKNSDRGYYRGGNNDRGGGSSVRSYKNDGGDHGRGGSNDRGGYYNKQNGDRGRSNDRVGLSGTDRGHGSAGGYAAHDRRGGHGSRSRSRERPPYDPKDEHRHGHGHAAGYIHEDRKRDSSTTLSRPPVQKTPQELAEIAERKRKLALRYG